MRETETSSLLEGLSNVRKQAGVLGPGCERSRKLNGGVNKMREPVRENHPAPNGGATQRVTLHGPVSHALAVVGKVVACIGDSTWERRAPGVGGEQHGYRSEEDLELCLKCVPVPVVRSLHKTVSWVDRAIAVRHRPEAEDMWEVSFQALDTFLPRLGIEVSLSARIRGGGLLKRG